MEYCDGSDSAAANLGCEYVLFWRDLADANLIEGAFTTATDAPVTVEAGQPNNLYVPDAKVGIDASVVVFSMPAPYYSPAGGITGGTVSCGVGSLCYALIALSGVNAGAYAPGPGLTPLDAFAIDSKIDDGLPTSGNINGGQPNYTITWDGPGGDTEDVHMQTAVSFNPPTGCLTIILPSPPVAPTPDNIQIAYAVSSGENPYDTGNNNPNVPTCVLDISGQ